MAVNEHDAHVIGEIIAQRETLYTAECRTGMRYRFAEAVLLRGLIGIAWDRHHGAAVCV